MTYMHFPCEGDMRLELLTVDWESGLFQLFGKSGLQSSKLIILPDPDPPEF